MNFLVEDPGVLSKDDAECEGDRATDRGLDFGSKGIPGDKVVGTFEDSVGDGIPDRRAEGAEWGYISVDGMKLGVGEVVANS